jgi:hypothetical protein
VKHRRRTWFSAPLVAVTASCSSSSSSDKPDVASYDTIARRGTACEYVVKMRCPKNASCNPPPPRAVECPAALGGGSWAAIGPKPGVADGTCLLFADGCSEPSCAVPTPCLDGAWTPLAPLAWRISPGEDGRCIAVGVSRTQWDSHPPVPLACPPGGAIERANVNAPCVVCAVSPCPIGAAPIACPDLKAP